MAVKFTAYDFNIPFAYRKSPSQKFHQFGIGFAFHRWSLNADFKGIAM